MINLLAINPIAFSLGPIEVRWYGILIATGIILAFLVVQREMVKRGMHPDFLTDLLIWAVPISIISARIYYVIFSWGYYKDNLGEVIQIWNGGIAIHGALIGAFITTYVFTKIRGISFWKVVDIAVAGLFIGHYSTSSQSSIKAWRNVFILSNLVFFRSILYRRYANR